MCNWTNLLRNFSSTKPENFEFLAVDAIFWISYLFSRCLWWKVTWEAEWLQIWRWYYLVYDFGNGTWESWERWKDRSLYGNYIRLYSIRYWIDECLRYLNLILKYDHARLNHGAERNKNLHNSSKQDIAQFFTSVTWLSCSSYTALVLNFSSSV